MTVKQEVLEMVAQLPDDCSLGDIKYHLYVLEKLQEAEESEARGEIYTPDEARQRLSRWLGK